MRGSVITQLDFLGREFGSCAFGEWICGTQDVIEQRERSFGILRKLALFGGRSDPLKKRILPPKTGEQTHAASFAPHESDRSDRGDLGFYSKARLSASAVCRVCS